MPRAADHTKDEQQQLLYRIAWRCPAIIELRELSLGFHTAPAADDSHQLRGWNDEARHSEFGPVVRLAYSLQKNISAVVAALDISWSSGQVEDQVNRLKTIKR